MNKKYFKGWMDVYGFTFRHATNGAGFKLVTFGVAILIIVAFIVGNIFNAKPEDAVKKSPIETVYVLDESGLPSTDYHGILLQYNNESFLEIDFIYTNNKTREEVIKDAKANSDKTVAVIIKADGANYKIEALIPEDSSISPKNAEKLLAAMITCFDSNKLMQAGLTNEQLMKVSMPVVTSIGNIGEDTNAATYLVKILAPMIFGFIMYFMLLTHGQTISKEVSTEKTSKLMETLLTSVHPYALITGKVLAISSMAILQFLTWIAAIFAGLYGGNAVARAMYPGYQNSVIQIIDFLKENVGETAFSLPAIILAIIIFCIGFLFYCVLAGLAGCMVTKPEDVASTQGIFVFPILISWMVCYFAPIMGQEGILNVARYVPFTIPFCVPVELITGNVTLLQGVISCVIVAAFSLIVIIYSAKIYKGLVLYTGQKISLKTLGKVIKG